VVGHAHHVEARVFIACTLVKSAAVSSASSGGLVEVEVEVDAGGAARSALPVPPSPQATKSSAATATALPHTQAVERTERDTEREGVRFNGRTNPIATA
jgi:uncharacterized protein (DUF2342 family)